MRPFGGSWRTPGGMCTSEPLHTGCSTPSDQTVPLRRARNTARSPRDGNARAPVDIDRMRPGGDVLVLPADQQISPAARCALAGLLLRGGPKARSRCEAWVSWFAAAMPDA